MRTQNEYKTNINKTSLEFLISKGFSIRDIAKEFNVAIGTIQYYMRKYNLRTIYSRPKRTREKINMELAKDYNNALWVDYTELSIKPKKHKKKRSIGVSGLTVICKNVKRIYLMDKHDKNITMRIIANIVKELKPEKALGDKEFYYLNEIIPTYKARTWNCSKQLNEKHHGLKAKVYDNLEYLKEILNLTDEQLLTTHRILVLAEYIKIFKRHNWEVINLIGKLSKVKQKQEIKAIIHP